MNHDLNHDAAGANRGDGRDGQTRDANNHIVPKHSDPRNSCDLLASARANLRHAQGAVWELEGYARFWQQEAADWARMVADLERDGAGSAAVTR